MTRTKTRPYLLLAGILLIHTMVGAIPTITGFTPASGPVGTVLTVKGTNLSNPTAFMVGGSPAVIVSTSDTQLVGMVLKATSGKVAITTALGIDSFGNFLVAATGNGVFAQQGLKLVGTGNIGTSIYQGERVAISADGNTAIVSGSGDNSNFGAAWVYIRSGASWVQQGGKLVGSGGVNPSFSSVAISADGNTAVVGGVYDNSHVGATWVFKRTGSTWAQQGPKLIGNDASTSNMSEQGRSVAISADGNTLVTCGGADSNNLGAAWVFVRSGNTWTQQGPKLVCSDSYGSAIMGWSVSLSADGNTMAIGGNLDSFSYGATWIFTRTAGVWSQQGSKLKGTGAVSTGSFGTNISQGFSTAISADGMVVAVGGPGDNNNKGAIWLFQRSGNNWSQVGSKLVPTGAIGGAFIGSSVSLSCDGSILIAGGDKDNGNIGAQWVFKRSGNVYTQLGTKLVGTGSIGSNIYQGCSVALTANGKTAFCGGYGDNSNLGAAWIFAASTCQVTGAILFDTICQGHPFNFYGQLLSNPGIYFDTLTSVAGCDSVITLNLTSRQSATFSFSQSICAGATYNFGGQVLSVAGVYRDTLTAQNGCDSIVILTLSVTNSSNHNFSQSICAGATYNFGGQVLSIAGVYRDTLTAQSGCDSIVILTLSVTNSSNHNISQSICAGATYNFGGQVLSMAGVYRDTLTAQSGCDSIVILTLSVTNPSNHNISQSICAGATYNFGGQVLSMAGVYRDTLSAQSGCDSIVILTLSIIPDSVVAHFSIFPSGTPHLWYAISQSTGNALQLEWFWGDGTSTQGDTPSHQYSSAGFYDICLKATGALGCVDVYCDSNVYLNKNEAGDMVYINVLRKLPNGIDVFGAENLQFFYGSGSIFFTKELLQPATLSLYDVSGNVIAMQRQFSGKRWLLSNSLTSGVYIIRVERNTQVLTAKLIVVP
ncbi:MAG: T9SS type A sorting domain-containing protein [Chitinophagales bacterium]